MPEVEAPVTGGKVDSDDLSGSGVSILQAIGGVGLASLIIAYGRDVGDFAKAQIASATGLGTSDQPSLQLGA